MNGPLQRVRSIKELGNEQEMVVMDWKDISSYRKSDKDRSTRTMQLQVAGMRIVVTRHVHHAPEDWVLICAPWFNERKVGDGTLADAQETALWLVRDRLADAMAALVPNAEITGRTMAQNEADGA